MSSKLTSKELTKAYARYARKHGHYVSNVRTVTVLRDKAIAEYREKKGGSRA